MKQFSQKYADYISHMRPRLRNVAGFSESIGKYLEQLNRNSIYYFRATIMGILSNYIEFIRANKDKYIDLYEKIVKPDPLLSDLEKAIDTVVKERKYQRLRPLRSGTIEVEEIDLENEISSIALKQSYDDMISFIGEIAGAWILTYPIEYLIKYDKVTYLREWATEENDCIFALRRYLATLHF